MSDKFGARAFAPTSVNDRLPKHDKNRISTFKEYREHMKKIEENTEHINEFQRRQRYDEIFDRYRIPNIERKYVFLSEIGKMNPKDPEFLM